MLWLISVVLIFIYLPSPFGNSFDKTFANCVQNKSDLRIRFSCSLSGYNAVTVRN